MLQADAPALVCDRIFNLEQRQVGGGPAAWFWVVANSQTQCILEYHAIAIYVGEVVISKSNLACDNTSMPAGSVVVAHFIKLFSQLIK